MRRLLVTLAVTAASIIILGGDRRADVGGRAVPPPLFDDGFDILDLPAAGFGRPFWRDPGRDAARAARAARYQRTHKDRDRHDHGGHDRGWRDDHD